MNIEDLRSHCLAFPNTTEGVKWEHNLCFMLFEKIFLLVRLEEEPTGMTFKIAPDNFNDMAAKDGFEQAPYFAKGQWLYLDDITKVSEKELKLIIQTSYDLIKSKLPKKLQVLC